MTGVALSSLHKFLLYGFIRKDCPRVKEGITLVAQVFTGFACHMSYTRHVTRDRLCPRACFAAAVGALTAVAAAAAAVASLTATATALTAVAALTALTATDAAAAAATAAAALDSDLNTV